jgi:serine/threonine-protein kinase RsbW
MMLKIRSSKQNIADLEVFIKSIFDEFDLHQDLYPNMLISLTEAVNNAILHGNRNDHAKSVVIETMKREDRVSFVIVDEGPGFDYNSLPDPTAPENLEKTGGRGVFLMQQLSDNVQFRENGSRVEIEFLI